MTLYQQRMAPVWESFITGKTRINNNLSKASRKGEYLIKKTNKSECVCGIGYLDHCYRADGWTTWGARKNAAWFFKEEALEITKKWRGIKIVKK